MKNFILQKIGLFFASLLLFSSCLEEGRNFQSGHTFGIVRFDFMSGKNLLDVSEIESFYHIRFQDTYDGNCFFVYYEIDFDAPENSYESIEANGYITVDHIDKMDVDRWPLSSNPFASDTTKAMMDEVVINDPVSDGNIVYFKGLMFVISELKMPADQTLYWHLTYDRDNSYTEQNGQIFVNLILRAAINRPGTKSSDNVGIANAFEMNHFFTDFATKVKESGSKTFKIRFYYPTEISEEGQMKWEFKNTNDIPYEWFISSE